MRTIITSIIIAAFSLTINGQNSEFHKPDYKGIKNIVDKKESSYDYKDLFKRYMDADTTLNTEECRIVYFGFLFDKSFTPYPVSDFTDSLQLMFKKDSLSSKDWSDIITYEKNILSESPFNPRDLNLLSTACLMTADTLSAIKAAIKMNMVIGAILSTGDGMEEASAWHVISISHEYDILSVLGFEFGGSQSLTKNGCDYLKVSENDNKIAGFYFDVNQILEREAKLLK